MGKGGASILSKAGGQRIGGHASTLKLLSKGHTRKVTSPRFRFQKKKYAKQSGHEGVSDGGDLVICA